MSVTRTRILPLLRTALTNNLNNKPFPLRFNSTLNKLHPVSLANQPVSFNYFTPVRYKGRNTNKKQQQDETETEKESDIEAEIADKNSKIMDIKVGSLRLDGILKSGLGIARNKIEVMFYESKIRLNGEKILKKSVSVQAGDEIDVIKGFSTNNPKFLIVARVEVLKATADEDQISMKIRRCKSLVIENYAIPFKSSSSSSSS